MGFLHDDGWFDILWQLCEDLEPLVAELEQATVRQFEILQVKEKFGGLRIHVNGADDAIRQRIEAADGNLSVLARFVGNRENCGKVVGSRLCATSIQLQLIQTAQTDPHSTS
jgi:hypothetical protein